MGVLGIEPFRFQATFRQCEIGKQDDLPAPEEKMQSRASDRAAQQNQSDLSAKNKAHHHFYPRVLVQLCLCDFPEHPPFKIVPLHRTEGRKLLRRRLAVLELSHSWTY